MRGVEDAVTLQFLGCSCSRWDTTHTSQPIQCGATNRVKCVIAVVDAAMLLHCQTAAWHCYMALPHCYMPPAAPAADCSPRLT